MGAVGAVAGVVQTGASLFGGGGGTQYVPNSQAMNEVQMNSISLLSQNYDRMSALQDQTFQSTLAMQNAEYKNLMQQLSYDQEYQKQQLLSQATQAQAATQAAETSLELQRFQQVYERGARDVAAKAEYANTLDSIANSRNVQNLVNVGTAEEMKRKLAETQAQMTDTRQARELEQSGQRLQRDLLATEYAGLSTQDRGILLQELQQQESLTNQLSQLGQQGVGLAEQQAGIDTQASQQRQQLINQFMEQARQQQVGNANKQAQLSSSGLVDPSGMIARQQMAQAINPVDQMKRGFAESQINTQQALGTAGVQNQQAYLGQLQQAALRGDALAQQQLALSREQLGTQRDKLDLSGSQLGLAEQQSALQYAAGQRGLQNQYGSLMNSVYMDAIQNGIAPELAAQLAERQATQKLNLTQGSAGVQGLLEDYGYDTARAGLAYSKAQDEQSLLDYLSMVDAQANLNRQSAEAQYNTQRASGYSQNAAMQSQLASGASAGINNAASQIRGATMVDSGGGGFNWAGLGNLAKAGVGLFSQFNQPSSGGGGYALGNANLPSYNSASAFIPNSGYTGTIGGYNSMNGYNAPFMGYK